MQFDGSEDPACRENRPQLGTVIVSLKSVWNARRRRKTLYLGGILHSIVLRFVNPFSHPSSGMLRCCDISDDCRWMDASKIGRHWKRVDICRQSAVKASIQWHICSRWKMRQRQRRRPAISPIVCRSNPNKHTQLRVCFRQWWKLGMGNGSPVFIIPVFSLHLWSIL
jgi:hypothetical protein